MKFWIRREIGWEDIGERFTRWEVVRCRWFSLLLHHLVAETAHDMCHTHPWWFVALVVRGGYWEFASSTGWCWRRPGSLLFRRAEWAHNVVTDSRGMWSIVLTGPRVREWGFTKCE